MALSSRQRRRQPQSVYGLAWWLLLALLMAAALHDDRLSLDRQCVTYANPRACRVF